MHVENQKGPIENYSLIISIIQIKGKPKSMSL